MEFSQIANVGYYGRAAAICALVMLLPTAVGPLLYAKWSGLSNEERKSQAELAMRLYLAMALAVVFGLVISARWLVLVLYTREFLPAVPPLRILAVGIALRCMFSVCNNVLASDGKAYVTACIMGLSVVAIAVLTVILVPYYGMNGAALADMIAGILVFGVGVFLLKCFYGLELKKMLLFRKDDFKYVLNAIRDKRTT